MQGFIEEYDCDSRKATAVKYWKPQDDIILLPDESNIRNQYTAKGSQHTANVNTMAMDILRTFRSILIRCSPALSDCRVPSNFWDLSFRRMPGKIKCDNQN